MIDISQTRPIFEMIPIASNNPRSKSSKYILRMNTPRFFFLPKENMKPIGTIETVLVVLKMLSRVVSIESDSNGFSLRFSNGVARFVHV